MEERHLLLLMQIAKDVDDVADEIHILDQTLRSRVVALNKAVLKLRRVIALQPETGKHS